MSIDFDLWRKELLWTGNIVQDGDTSVPQQEKEKRFNRYIEMLDAVSGQEGIETFIAIVESLQVKADYGAYQSTFGTLRRFPPKVAAQGFIVTLPRLIERQPDYAGYILSQLAISTQAEPIAVLSAFQIALGSAPVDAQKSIMNFVIREEKDGWLDGRGKGVIRFRDRSTRPWWKFW